MCIMNDWKLKTTPVVRLQQPDETFVQYNFFVFLMVNYLLAIQILL